MLTKSQKQYFGMRWCLVRGGSSTVAEAEETSPEFGVYIFYNITFSTFFGQKKSNICNISIIAFLYVISCSGVSNYYIFIA